MNPHLTILTPGENKPARAHTFPARPWSFVFALVLLLIGAGCQTMSFAPGSSARVILYNCTKVQAADAVFAVFKDNGYEYFPQKTDELIFDKEGSTAQTVAHGSWMDGPVWYRVKLRLMPRADGSLWIEAVAFRVTAHGDSIMEEEKALPMSQRKHYQKILDQVEKRVMSGGKASTSPATPPTTPAK
jgi:hypothetical protein